MNVVALLGRMVADPELRQTPQGTSVVQFRIAVNRSFVKQGEERKADFIDIVAWRQTAEFVSKYFKKGNNVGISGSLQTRTYTDKEGKNRYVVEILADNVYFAESKNTQGNTASAPAPIPTAMPMTSAPAPSYSAGGNDDFTVIDSSEDLPF